MEIFEALILIVSAFIATEFIVAYHVKTRGGWRDTPMGKHLMVFMAAIAVVLDVTAIEDFVEDVVGFTTMPEWWEWFETSVFISIPCVLLWRRIILARVHEANHVRSDNVDE